MNSEFIIRQMMPSDADSVKQIIDVSFSRFLGFFALHSLSEEGAVFVAEAQGAVVGFVKLISFQVGSAKFGCIFWIAVHPHFRRKGVASALTNEGTQQLKKDGAKAVFASTQRRNTGALRVLTLNGFRRMGFLELWRLFGGRVFAFYRDIWLAPGEVVLMHE